MSDRIIFETDKAMDEWHIPHGFKVRCDVRDIELASGKSVMEVHSEAIEQPCGCVVAYGLAIEKRKNKLVLHWPYPQAGRVVLEGK